MTKIYIAGPMTGFVDHNFPAFNEEADRLRGLGHEVVNPADLNPLYTGAAWISCMKNDLHALIDCEEIRMLRGWRLSRGAKLEHYVACALGMPYTEQPEPTDMDAIFASAFREATK